MSELIGASTPDSFNLPINPITDSENSHRTNNRQVSAAYTSTTKGGGAVNQKICTNKKNTPTITLDAMQEEQFCSAIKLGIYKSLHQKGLLTDMQLFELVSNINN